MRKYNLTALVALSFIANAGYGMDDTGLYGLPGEDDPLARRDDAPAPGESVRKRRGTEAVPPPKLPTVPAKPKQTSRIMGVVASFKPYFGNLFGFGDPVPGNFQEIQGLLGDKRLNNVRGVSIDPKTSEVSTEVLKVTGHLLSELPWWTLEKEVLFPYFSSKLNDASLLEKLEAFQTDGVTDGVMFVKISLHKCMTLLTNKTIPQKVSFAKRFLRLSPEAFQSLVNVVKRDDDLSLIITALAQLDAGEMQDIVTYGGPLFKSGVGSLRSIIKALKGLDAGEIGPRVEAIMPYLGTELFAGMDEHRRGGFIATLVELDAGEIGPTVGAIEQCLEEPWFNNVPYMDKESQLAVIAALAKLDVSKIEAIRKHAEGFFEEESGFFDEGYSGFYKATVIEALRELDVGKIEAIGEFAAELFQDLDADNRAIIIRALGELDVGEIVRRVKTIMPHSGGVFEVEDGLLFPGLGLDGNGPGEMIKALVELDEGDFEKAISRTHEITSGMTVQERLDFLLREEEEGSSSEED